jgi:predicted ATPase
LATGPSRIVLTGASGAGKTSVLCELKRRGYAVVREVARAVLQRPGGMLLRQSDPDGFVAAIFEGELARFSATEMQEGLVFLDRGFGDVLSMSTSNEVQRARMVEAVSILRYDGPIFQAPPWKSIYRQDDERIQSWHDAVASDAGVCAAWRKCGYELVDLPLGETVERADFVFDYVD